MSAFLPHKSFQFSGSSSKLEYCETVSISRNKMFCSEVILKIIELMDVHKIKGMIAICVGLNQVLTVLYHRVDCDFLHAAYLYHMEKKKILFVCVENSNRSQMSQAFATMLGGGQVEAYSAGSRPSGKINPKAISAMKELGYDLAAHASKSLEEVKSHAPFDVVVTMGCGDACPWMPAEQFVDWQIPDPRNMEPDEFRQVRDLIKEKVDSLLQESR